MKSSLRFRKVGWDCEDYEFVFESPRDALDSLRHALEHSAIGRFALADYFCELANERGQDEDDYSRESTDGTPVCDELDVLIDEADRIHFLPFQFQGAMPIEAWGAVSGSWDSFLSTAPLDEDARMNWQVCITRAEFLGLPG